MQRTQKTVASEKWKPMPISNPTSRIRAACKMPPWMAKGSSSLSVAPPAPTEPPPTDPDYEVIEFPSQQYTNTAPIRSNDKRHASQDGNNGLPITHRCDLCGSSVPCVCCEKCNNQTFCISCDDMYHRHPKRQNHVRKALDGRNQVLPPLPPKGETFVPPVPPPRRHKKSSRMTTPTPEEQNRHFKKEGSIIGSLKRFIGGRPLPPTPQTLRDPRFLHSSTLPLSTMNLNDQPSSHDSGYLDWESDLKHRSGSLTALNNSCFPPLMQAQSMAQLNCPSCHQQGMMWDLGNRANHFHSRTLNPWANLPTGTWHGSQILPSNFRRQNISPFEDLFWRRPGVPYPPSRSSTRSKRDLNSLHSYEDEIESKMDHDRTRMFRGASPALSRRNYASSDSDDEIASKRSGSCHRRKKSSRQSREVSPALSRCSVRQNNKIHDDVFSNRGSRRFKKSTASRNITPVRSRKNSRRELSDSDENNTHEVSNRNPSPALSTRSSKPNHLTKQQYNPNSSIESIKDSSSSDQNPNENENTPFVPTVAWECQHCTFVNKSGSRICAVCCKTTSALRIKNKSLEQEELAVEEEKLNQSVKDLNIKNASSSPFKMSDHKAENKLSNHSIKSYNVESNIKQHGKALTSSSSMDVNFEKAVISTGTSPPPQSISTQTYDVGGNKLRRAASLADHDLWKAPTRSISRQSILSDSTTQSFPMTPARTPDLDEALINFESQQLPKNPYPIGRRSFDAVTQNVIRPSARRAGSQPPEYLSTMVQKQVKQGLEMVKLLREAEQHHFTADDLSVALTHCGENDPVAWLLNNWQNMIDTVVTLATNNGHERKENTIGTISAAEARDALRVHNGNVWDAVNECVGQRQKKYSELSSRGNFSCEDIVTVLTANHGDLDLAYKELSKSQLKPFLMRIWGPPQGVDNDCGDTSKLYRNDSFEQEEPDIESDNIKDFDEVSVRDNFKFNQMRILHDESSKNKKLSMDFDDMSLEQLKILECTEALKNIRTSVYDNDVISASLKLGLQNILRQDKKLSDHITSIKSALKSEPPFNSQDSDKSYLDASTYLQSVQPIGIGRFDPTSSPVDNAGDHLVFNAVSNDKRPSWIRKRGFSHALKSNFQPYRTVSVCDLSDSVADSTQNLSISQSSNQINLSTVYYNDSVYNPQSNQHNSNSNFLFLNCENNSGSSSQSNQQNSTSTISHSDNGNYSVDNSRNLCNSNSTVSHLISEDSLNSPQSKQDNSNSTISNLNHEDSANIGSIQRDSNSTVSHLNNQTDSANNPCIQRDSNSIVSYSKCKNDSANNLQSKRYVSNTTVSDLNCENSSGIELIPQLYMEVMHETHNFNGAGLDEKHFREKGPLKNEVTEEKHAGPDDLSEINRKVKDAESVEFSDSEIFYETFSNVCDNSESLNGDQSNSHFQTEHKSEKANTYNVQFEKDLVFVTSDVDNAEQRIVRRRPSTTNENGDYILEDGSGLNKSHQNMDGNSNESQNEVSNLEENEKSRSISEDSSKDYQSVEEYIPRKPTTKSKAVLDPTTELGALNKPKAKLLFRSNKKSVASTVSLCNSNKKVDQLIKEPEIKQKVFNSSIKLKKKMKRPVLKKAERKISLNSISSKMSSQTSNKASHLSSLTNEKHQNAVLQSKVSSKIKPSQVSNAAQDSSIAPSEEIPTNINANSMQSCIRDGRNDINTILKDQDLLQDSKPQNDSRKSSLINDNEVSSLLDDYSTDSELKADQTIVDTEILQVEPADVDCDDANPKVLEILSDKNTIIVDAVSEINSLGLSPQNYEPNSSDSTMKNILSISDDSSCQSIANASDLKLDEALEAISTSGQRSSSTDTHAGVESTNLDEGNESVGSRNLSMIENRAEILQLLKDSLADDHVLKGIVHTLFSSIVGSNQCEVETSAEKKDKNQEESNNDSDTLFKKALIELKTATSEKISDQYPSNTEIKVDGIASCSEELNFQRKARRYLAEGVVSNFDQAKLVVHLLELNFDKELSISAAKECSNLETAISFLQQECLLCAEKYSVNQMVSMLSCQHLCCRECALQYFTLQIMERNINDCVCPFCKEPNLTAQNPDYVMNYFSNLDIVLKSLLHPEVHELFQRKLRDRTLMQDPNFKWCAECSFGFIADLRQKRLTCPDCKAVSCAFCHRRWTKEHEGKTCEEYDEWLEANDPGSVLAKHLVNEGVTCPACNSKYALVKGGCMHLTCPGCKHEFCSDCSKTFLMGSKCTVSPFCEKLGLHAHHPRNCLFYLRDKEPEKLERLLQDNNVNFDKTEKENKMCNVQLQRETSDGLVDGLCNFHVFQAGLCRRHYIEYLSLLVRRNDLETIDILTSDDFETILKRAGIKLPPNPYGYPPENHFKDLYKVLALTHYIEYLVTLVSRHKLDPIVIFELNEVQQELRRHGKVLPTRASNAKDEDYLILCVKMVQEQIPLD